MSENNRPEGGHCFEVVRLEPEGWVVLCPWMRTPAGNWWRPHVDLGFSSEGLAKSYTEQLNAREKELLATIERLGQQISEMALAGRAAPSAELAENEGLRENEELRKYATKETT